MIFRLFLIAIIPFATSGCANTDNPAAWLQDVRLPAIMCLKLDTNTAASVARSDIRLQIDVRNRVASNRYSGALTLTLLHSDGGRSLVHTFSMHPDRLENGRVAPQSFHIVPDETPLVPNANGSVCFELSAETTMPFSEAAAHRDIALHWIPIPKTENSK